MVRGHIRALGRSQVSAQIGGRPGIPRPQARGSVTVKTVPCQGALVTSSVPP